MWCQGQPWHFRPPGTPKTPVNFSAASCQYWYSSSEWSGADAFIVGGWGVYSSQCWVPQILKFLRMHVLSAWLWLVAVVRKWLTVWPMSCLSLACSALMTGHSTYMYFLVSVHVFCQQSWSRMVAGGPLMVWPMSCLEMPRTICWWRIVAITCIFWFYAIVYWCTAWYLVINKRFIFL